MKRILVTATYLSFLWNLILVTGVMLNAPFSFTRAAGGQYIDFPNSIRVVYLVNMALVLYQLLIFRKLEMSRLVRPAWLPTLFFIVSCLGVAVNAISRTPNERYNVIPAAIIAFAFWKFGKISIVNKTNRRSS